MIVKWILVMIIATPMGEVQIHETAKSSTECTHLYRTHAMALLPHEKVRYAQCSPVEEDIQKMRWSY